MSCLTRPLFGLQLAGILLGIAAAASADPVLIYSDRSAGTHATEYVLTQSAIASGAGVEVRRKVPTFVAALAQDQWSEIHVIMKYQSSPPAFLSALQAYAANSDDRITFYLWHDNGVSTTAGTEVKSVDAVSVWGPGNTITTYSNAYLDAEGRKQFTRIVSGRAWPTFDGVALENPTPIPHSQWSVENDPAQIQIIGWAVNCPACLTEYREDMDEAKDWFARWVQGCRRLSSADAIGQAVWLSRGLEIYSQRMRSAKSEYTLCIAVCPIGPSPTID